MQKTLLILFIFSSISLFAQKDEKVKSNSLHLLRGRIVNAATDEVLNKAHVINLNSVIGTTTDDEGRFNINVQELDTLYFSFLGYQSLKLKITSVLLKEKYLKISMHEMPTDLEEVLVKSYELIGVLEVDAKNVPNEDFAQIHINGLPQTFETGAPKSRLYNKPTDAIFHPVDFMYELFGKKPKQLRKLKKLRREDELREILEEKANREILMQYLEMDVTQINSLLDYCNYSEYFINNASDLQVIEAVLECYENYKALRIGTTKREIYRD